MPEQYTITGTITPSDGAERAGVRVQAFDRDLPSRERRAGLGLQLLGEALADAEGRFHITHTLEQFESGEAMSTFRRSRAKNADVSFRAFDSSGQELNIKGIEALNREYRSDQIIFNAPTPLEVSIFVDGTRESGASEYERLIALIAPVVEDLPLIELSDDDIAFLSNELGLEQQRERLQHLEWLRRSTLLAQQSELPVEAFYGWGRKNVPAAFDELAAIPLDALPKALETLISRSEHELRTALLAAVEEQIIPPAWRERASAITSAVRRRTQIERTVRLRLEGEPDGEALAGYMVTAFDTEENSRDLGTDVTEPHGEFTVVYFDAAAADIPRSLPRSVTS